MPLYRTSGVLTGTIAPENVSAAQRYLSHDHSGEPNNMAQYLYDALAGGPVEVLQWHLDADGHHWHVDAFATRELTGVELLALGSQVSGQNSDGLGEGFEQQEFAWDGDQQEDEDCINCSGSGLVNDEDCISCDGEGISYADPDAGRMISFDWEKNDCKFVRVV